MKKYKYSRIIISAVAKEFEQLLEECSHLFPHDCQISHCTKTKTVKCEADRQRVMSYICGLIDGWKCREHNRRVNETILKHSIS